MSKQGKRCKRFFANDRVIRVRITCQIYTEPGLEKEVSHLISRVMVTSWSYSSDFFHRGTGALLRRGEANEARIRGKVGRSRKVKEGQGRSR